MAAPRELRLEGREDDEPEEDRPRGQSERSQRRHRASIRERLFSIFDALADSLEGRGDEELAGIIREDSRAMVGGLESLIRKVPAMASPILGGLAVLEPLIAFGRIFRLLTRRMRERREAALEAAYYEEQPVPDSDEPAPAPEPAPTLEREGIPLAGEDVARPWDLSGER